MLNPEEFHSSHFEELCALAASGQISEPEFFELQDHMQDCARCRSAYEEFIDLLHSKLPLAAPERVESNWTGRSIFKSSSYRERFLTQARKRGLAISGRLSRDSAGGRLAMALWPIGFAQAAAAMLVLLLATAAVLGYNLRRINLRYTALAANVAAMSQRHSPPGTPLRAPTEEGPVRPAQLPTTPVSPAVTQSSRTDAELDKARNDYAAAAARSKAMEEQLQAVASELRASKALQEAASDSQGQLVKKLSEAELGLSRASDELQRIRQGRADDAATMTAQAREIRQLSAKLSDQTETLERNIALLAASRDIHDLMGARNLHIVDVLDVDSKGKDKRAVGRVFYTEEKSLIFYAFDLGDRGTARRNASFQVWGARGPAQQAARNLGIFYVDDQKQNRWVLKFEDPGILAEIDSVFVTVEPQGGSPRPTGRRLLYAYLKSNLNHP